MVSRHSTTNSTLIRVLDLFVSKEVKLVIKIPVADGLVVDKDLKGVVRAEDEGIQMLLWTDSRRRGDTMVRGEGHCTMYNTTHDRRTHTWSMFNVTPQTPPSSGVLTPIGVRTVAALLFSPTGLLAVAPVYIGGGNALVHPQPVRLTLGYN